MMRILAIESSCDETAVAIVEGHGDDVNVVSSLVRSQIDIHAEYGGVVPEVAAREHLEMIMPMLRREAPADGSGIDAVAVTYGPGLAPALRVGLETGKALAYAWGKPFVPVCHLEGHIYAAWLAGASPGSPIGLWPREVKPQFPALALIVSGGHTEFVLMRDHGVFERLVETLDDAAGEAFDKVAKMLGLGYPGGPKVDALGSRGRKDAFAFPRSMCERDDLMMSFSGLKTSVLYTVRDHESLKNDPAFQADICASFGQAVIDILLCKTKLAVENHGPMSVILAGGVAANKELRRQLGELCAAMNVACFVPPFAYSLDNAAMIGVAGYFRFLRGDVADPLTTVAEPNLDIV